MRSCYNTKMRFSPGDPTQSAIQWFYAAKGAKLFPSVTGFGSSIWAREDAYDPNYGEVEGAPRTYSFGTRLPGSSGVKTCGSINDLYHGAARLTTPRPVSPINGAYLCCEPSCYPIWEPVNPLHFQFTGGPFINAPLTSVLPNVWFCQNAAGDYFQFTVNPNPCSAFGSPRFAFNLTANDHVKGARNNPYFDMIDPAYKHGILQFPSNPGAWYSGNLSGLLEM